MEKMVRLPGAAIWPLHPAGQGTPAAAEQRLPGNACLLYTSFGGGAISPENRKCMESWKKYCPDYKIIEWNEQNVSLIHI